ncbi:MAG: CTP synthase [Rubinisphaera brasiliensis]|uniref:CTP synthase n=1 Tax=Rubinisphaera brasiliensis (strain ATCC 49424 / DSM 5305 / JCM 21570 / IAM 15109 / NBRC 103401 / IFAM 1448) TaxID=756272 RepID=F0SGC4_RUBBR|nr:CTP synthase [Rubinisphaera brasiliensis]ADY60523.1 CTP synthase [Rubinisphaera brasiliensis DSM 5305]
MTKHIFVTGGVVSSLGKGLTSASVGLLLERRGLKIRMQKLDPYLNVDPGTMSPYQHGEVYVLDDGSETDLDLGHYERFTNSPLSRKSNYTTGQIYQSVLDKERRGEYLGATVQVIPHVTEEIKNAIFSLAAPDVDVVITELGGTVGDIEGLPFLEAIRQVPLEIGRENCLFIHLTLVPYLKAARELKTKPTQHSVGQLRQIGIQPDILVVRTERPLGRDNAEKIGLFCNVEKNAVIEEVDKTLSIYEVPLGLAENRIDRLISDKLGIQPGPLNLDDWRDLLHNIRHPEHEVTIAVVGKYIEHRDAYKSIYESLDHAGFASNTRVIIKRVAADELEEEDPELLLSGVDGILVPGGFGMRGVEGKIRAIQFAREKKIPYYGICLGMQCAVIEFARNVLKLEDANSTEFEAKTGNPVICLLEEQKKITYKGGTMRLGAQPCVLTEGSHSRELYGSEEIHERHRHRYEFNPAYRQAFEEAGLQFAGTSPDGNLVEIVEVADHPWFVAVQFHPEFRSKPLDPHPLFEGFINAALARHQEPANV